MLRTAASVHRIVATAALTLTVGSAACSPRGNDAAPVPTTTPAISTATPTTTATDAFCGAMFRIREQAQDPTSTFDTAELIKQYQAAAEIAPPEIRSDLDALIASLQNPAVTVAPTGQATADSDGIDGDGWRPANTPAERVLDFVDTQCPGSARNAAPPATQPR